MSKSVTWIDLEAYGARLAILDDSKANVRRFVLAPLNESPLPADSVNKNIEGIGELLSWQKIEHSGKVLFLNPAPDQNKINLADFLRDTFRTLTSNGFQKAAAKKISSEDVFLKTETAKAKPTEKKPETGSSSRSNGWDRDAQMREMREYRERKAARDEKISSSIRAAIKLGQNNQGHTVYELPAKEGEQAERFMVDKYMSHEAVFESDNNKKATGGTFLRALTTDDLKACIFVVAGEILDGRAYRMSNMKDFASKIFGEDYTQDQWRQLINGVDNHFSALMQSEEIKTVFELFQKSNNIFERTAYLGQMDMPTDGIADLNLPISTIIHMLSNSLSDDDTKALFINPGKAAPFSRWHRGRKGRFQIFETRDHHLEGIQLFSNELKLRRRDIVTEESLKTDNDVVIANLQTGDLDGEAYSFDGRPFSRKEFKTAFEILEQRSEEGNAVFTFPADVKDKEYNRELDAFIEALGQHYAVEGIAEIDSTVYANRANAGKLMMIAVSNRRPEALNEPHEASQRRKDIFTADELLQWAMDTAQTSRAKIDNFFSTFKAQQEGEDDREKNSLQSPYISASGGEAYAMIPKHLEAPQRRALARLQDEVEAVSSYASIKLGMSEEKIWETFSAEQIDLFALEALSEEKGKLGFHIADDTGMGKGRSMAGIAGRYAMDMRKVLMMTKDTGNIDDILRDLVDSGMIEHVNPLILNSNKTTTVEEPILDPETREQAIDPETGLPQVKKKRTTVPYSYTDPKTGKEYKFDGMNAKEAFDEFTEYEWVPFEVRSGELTFTRKDTNETETFDITDVGDVYTFITRRLDEDDWEFEAGHVSYVDTVNKKDIDVELTTERVLKGEFPAPGQIRNTRQARRILRVFTPDDYNLVIASYPQLNRDYEKLVENDPHSYTALKHKLVDSFVDEDTVLSLDEVAEVTGSGNTAKNFRTWMERSYRRITASATHASDPKTLGFYHYLLPEEFFEEELVNICQKFGDTAAEIFTRLMVEEGVMVRREHDNGRMNVSFFHDEENFEKNCEFIDKLAPILSELAYMAGDLKNNINTMAEDQERNANLLESWLMTHDAAARRAVEENGGDPNEIEQRNPEVEMDGALAEMEAIAEVGNRENAVAQLRAARASLKRLGVQGLGGIGSPFYRIMKTSYAALKAETAAKIAIEHNQQGGRSIVVCDTVVTAILDEAYASQEESGQAPNRAPDIKDLLRREITGLSKHAGKRLQANRYQRPEERQIDENTLNIVEKILERVDREVPDLPISIVDVIKRKISDAGLLPGEITGRSLEFDGEKIGVREKTPASEIYHRFNNEDVDIIVATRPGLTGYSGHDAPQFKNHGQRRLIFSDAPMSVRDVKQAFGRVLRLGSMTDPIVSLINTGVPAEQHIYSTMVRKLSAMSAITTANRTTSFGEGEVVDLYNTNGNRVCREYLALNQSVARAMGLDLNYTEDFAEVAEAQGGIVGHLGLDKYSAHRILSRLGLLGTEEQRVILNNLQFEYQSLVDELDRTNSNPDKPNTLPGVVRIVDQQIIDGLPNQDAVYISHGIQESTVDPLSSGDIDELVTKGLASFNPDRAAATAGMIRDSVLADYREQATAAGFQTIEEMLDSNSHRGKKPLYEKKMMLANLVERLTPGTQIEFFDHYRQQISQVVVTKVRPPERMLLDPSAFKFDYAAPGDVHELPENFSTLLEQASDGKFINDFVREDGSLRITGSVQDSTDEADAILEAYDQTEAQSRERKVRFLTGYAPRILQILQEQHSATLGKLGVFSGFVDKDSESVVQGAYITRRFWDPEMMRVPLRTTDKIMDALDSGIRNPDLADAKDRVAIYPNKECHGRILTLVKEEGSYKVQLPAHEGSRDGKLYKIDEMTAFLEEMERAERVSSKGNSKWFETQDPEEMRQFVDIVNRKMRITYFAPTYFHEWSAEWAAERAQWVEMVPELNLPDRAA